MSNYILLLAVLLVAFGSANAEPTNAPGGNGGIAFRLQCPGTSTLVGLKTRSGSEIDNVSGICRQVHNGNWVGTEMLTPPMGGTGGTPITRRCPNGQGVTGMKVRAGKRLDRIELECRNINSEGYADGAVTTLEKVGGSGGKPDSLSCALNLFGKDILGRVGRKGNSLRIFQIQLDCARAGGSVNDNRDVVSWHSSGKEPTVCPSGNSVMTEMKCKGKRCSSLSYKCIKVPGAVVEKEEWLPKYSEEEHIRQCDEGLIAGIQCTGKFCDNVSVMCRKMENFKRSCSSDITRKVTSTKGPVGFKGKGALNITCRGSHCAEKSFRLCTLEPVEAS